MIYARNGCRMLLEQGCVLLWEIRYIAVRAVNEQPRGSSGTPDVLSLAYDASHHRTADVCLIALSVEAVTSIIVTSIMRYSRPPSLFIIRI